MFYPITTRTQPLAKRFEWKKEIERDWIRVRRGDRFAGYRGQPSEIQDSDNFPIGSPIKPDLSKAWVVLFKQSASH